MAKDAGPARVGVIGLGYWGPNLVRNLTSGPVQLLCRKGGKTPKPYQDIISRPHDSISSRVSP